MPHSPMVGLLTTKWEKHGTFGVDSILTAAIDSNHGVWYLDTIYQH